MISTEKDKSELEIAGSLRNIFKYSFIILERRYSDLEADGYLTVLYEKSTRLIAQNENRTLNAKVYSQKGNSPN